MVAESDDVASGPAAGAGSGSDGEMARRLGLGDAVVIGLGSMIGAGVFAVWGPAAGAAGTGLLLGLGLAGLVAFCNATSSAQLAAQYPTSGGTYVYGREILGPWAGFLAGWAFVVGKTASSAAMALTFAAYVAPVEWRKPLAVAAVMVLAVVNSRGVSRTAGLARILVAVSLAALAVVVSIGFTHLDPSAVAQGGPWTALGVLQSAGFLFFAFAGYARMATMGEEVIAPERTIPRAIVLALAIAFAVYLLVGVAAVGALGPAGLAVSGAPLAEVASKAAVGWPVATIRVGAACAALGALLAMLAGIGRTSLAMARNGDLPRWLAAVHPRFRVPHRAELAVGALVSVLVVVTDLRGAIGFSSFGVLLYYLIANISALRQQRAHRRYPRVAAALGAVGCVVIAATLPPEAVLGGVAVLAIGLAWRWASVRLRA